MATAYGRMWGSHNMRLQLRNFGAVRPARGFGALRPARTFGAHEGVELHTLEPFPTGEGNGPLLIPEEIDVELELFNGDDNGTGLGPFGVGTTPGAVPVRVENWDLEAQPFAKYTIATGDTFVGLSATYLGSGARWKEIYKTGGNQAMFPKADEITHEGPIDMPEETREKMNVFLKKGKTGLPGKITTTEIKEEKAEEKAKEEKVESDKQTRKTAMIVGAVAAAAVVAGGVYYVTR